MFNVRFCVVHVHAILLHKRKTSKEKDINNIKKYYGGYSQRT